MPVCLFASDLHGYPHRYEALFDAMERRVPAAVFIAGDLLPFPLVALDPRYALPDDFLRDYLAARLAALCERMGGDYPTVFLILGNDDPRVEESALVEGDAAGLWSYCHQRRIGFGGHDVYGYNYVPPTPFQLKDWERYDVSRYVPPGCVSPEEGRRSVEVDARRARFDTIKDDLDELVKDAPLDNAVFLFHTPPSDTRLDRAANDGKSIDHVPLDLHVGSVAVRRFIESRQPLLTLHGHIHESTRLTGAWRDRIARTHMFNAAHDGPELSLVSFDLADLESATRELL
jgi:Icc-related predicted phosphoesterase